MTCPGAFAEQLDKPFELEFDMVDSDDAIFQQAGRHIELRQQIVLIISCFILTFTGCGVNFAFGVYEEIYESAGGPFRDASPGAISLIGTLAASLMTLGAPIASSWCTKYGARSVLLVGGGLFAISGIAASFGTKLWHFQLSQGFLQGCASCLIYIPAVIVSPRYFDKRRSLAMGIITSGTGFGGMIWAPCLRYLVSLFGYRKAIRMTGVIAGSIVTFAACALGIVKKAPNKASKTRDNQEFHDGEQVALSKEDLIFSLGFVSHGLGTCLQAAAYMTPVYFMSSFARTRGYSRTAGANIIALSDGFNSGGKILIGYYADRLGSLNALVLSTFISAVATFAFCYVSNSDMNDDIQQVLIVLYACVYGAAAGGYVSLFPTALLEQFRPVDFAKVSGLLYMIRGLGTLVGTPLGGTMVQYGADSTRYSSFDKTFLLVAFLLLGATACAAWARSLRL
jgi:MFS family permease